MAFVPRSENIIDQLLQKLSFEQCQGCVHCMDEQDSRDSEATEFKPWIWVLIALLCMRPSRRESV